MIWRLPLIVAVAILPAASGAAPTLDELGVSYAVSLSEDFTGKWGNGIGGRLGLLLGKPSPVELHAVLEVMYYPYTGDNLGLFFPDDLYYRHEIDGHGTTRFSLSSTIRLHGGMGDRRYGRGYLWGQVGVAFVDIGDIELTEWWVHDPGSRATHVLSDSGQLEAAAHVSFGFGLAINAGEHHCLVLETGTRISTGESLLEVPLSLVVQFGR
jgi:hypothetical protein